jgi:hypothetical protein
MAPKKIRYTKTIVSRGPAPKTSPSGFVTVDDWVVILSNDAETSYRVARDVRGKRSETLFETENLRAAEIYMAGYLTGRDHGQS